MIVAQLSKLTVRVRSVGRSSISAGKRMIISTTIDRLASLLDRIW
jgi:hypothetical protein